nr:hypothetical protein [Endozoicomonas sp.]
MPGQINGNIGITPPQNPSTKGAEQSQNLTASKPGALNRTSITTYPPRKNLSNPERSSRPAPTPLTSRQAAIKPNNLDSVLNLFKQGVEHTSKQVENLKNKSPTDSREKKLHTKKMKDTLKHMERLEKAIQNELKDLILKHNQSEISAFDTTETPENKALYETTSKILGTLNKNIKTLKTLKTKH